MLESQDMSEGSLMVLAHTYNDVKYSPCPFPGTVAAVIADDAKWDLYTMTLSNITVWFLLSDKDGKVICPKELVSHNQFKHFSMSGKILW